MSWETHEAAKKIADGWYSELEATRERNAVLGRENAQLRKVAKLMLITLKSRGIVGGVFSYPYTNSNAEERVVFEDALRELGVDV